jgi:hypothetical protein
LHFGSGSGRVLRWRQPSTPGGAAALTSGVSLPAIAEPVAGADAKKRLPWYRPEWFSWPLAAYAHLILFLLLGLMFVEPPIETRPLVLTATFVESQPAVETPTLTIPADEPAEPEEDIPEEPADAPDTPADVPPLVETHPIAQVAEGPVETPTVEPAAASEVAAHSSDKPSSEGDPSKKIRPPQPPLHAVEAGNFAAWTEPPFPKPGEPYYIVLLIRLPDHVKRYPQSDLTGLVIGSDGFRKPIWGSARGTLPLVHQTVRIMIPVVGSQHGSVDTIMVQSRILRERRMIRLVSSPAPAIGT